MMRQRRRKARRKRKSQNPKTRRNPKIENVGSEEVERGKGRKKKTKKNQGEIY